MILKKDVKEIVLVGIVLAIIATYFVFTTAQIAFGNPTYQLGTCSTGASITGTLDNGAAVTLGTGSATTVVAYLVPGVSTTTLTCDMAVGGASRALPDGATGYIQLAGSSTATQLNIDVQYSQDGIDWYADSLVGMGSQVQATTSPSLGTVEQFNFLFASSTINRVAVTNANSATSARIVNLSMIPTRYVRFIFSLSPTGAGGALWAEIRGRKQNN